MKYLLLFILPLCAYTQQGKEIFTMFYNVENLFDTINSPHNNDDEFLPKSEKKWNTKKYNKKINQLTQVFAHINNGKLPNIIGLCEIENKLVIQDLLKKAFFNMSGKKPFYVLIAPIGQLCGNGQLRETISERRNRKGDDVPFWYLSPALLKRFDCLILISSVVVWSNS